MRSTTTAASTRSLRCLGKNRPRLGSPTWWPARPMRWRPRLTAPGDSTWTTRSTAPMSMPSSSELVATRPFRSPLFRRSSIWRRRSRLSDPWWARTSSWPSETGGRPSASAARFSPSTASSLSRVARRSASRRLLTNTMVDRCSWMSWSRRGCMAGQMLRRTGPAATGPLTGSSITSPRAPMSSTGTTTSMSRVLRTPASTMVTGRARGGPPGAGSIWPPRKRAISSSGRWVADRPMRWNGRSALASRRSSESARWAPRLVGARAWISSMMTDSTERSVSRACEVSIR